MKKFERLFKILYGTGLLLIGFIVVDVLASVILFCFKLNISVINFWASLIITLIAFILIGAKDNKTQKNKLLSIALFLVVLFGAIFVASKIYV